jgi:hypothetical protein
VYERKDIPSMNPECYRRKPSWTVLANSAPLNGGHWVGTSWEFFDDEVAAQHRYEELSNAGRYPTKRPYHSADAAHLGAVHAMRNEG